MNLAVDARWMVGRLRGMGRYAQSLLVPVANDVCALLPQGFPSAPYRTVRQGRGFFPYWEQHVLPRLCEEHDVEHLVCPYNTGPLRLRSRTQLTLVVHDLIYLASWSQLPASVSAYQTLGRVYRRWVVPRLVGQAARLVTVSEYTRDEICSRFGVAAHDVHVIPNSIDDRWFTQADEPPVERQPYVLAVAGEAPSKNLPALMRAFALFLRRGGRAVAAAHLRVAGVSPSHHAVFLQQAQTLGIAPRVQFVPFVDDAALRHLYREAHVFVMPSLYEGFGIPLLEAMASETPVACSNTTALPEVVGNAAWLFDPRDDEAIAISLIEAWTDEAGRRERVAAGVARARRYDRATVAQDIEAFWRAC